MHKTTKRIALTAVTLLTIAATATPALATPKSTSVLLLPGDAFPVLFSTLPTEPNTIPSELQNAAGTLASEGFLAQGDITSPTGGLIEMLFLRLKEPTANVECLTSGERAGEILDPRADFHFVHDENPEKGAAILVELPEFELKCPGGPTVKLKGTMLGLVLNVPSGDILSSLTLTIHCSGTLGEPSDVHYWTSLLSSELTALLLTTFGSGFRKSCEQINGTTGTIKIDIAKMIEVMNP